MTANVSIALRDNEDWRDAFVLRDPSSLAVPPAALVLTDATLTMHVRKAATDSSAVFIASTDNDKINTIVGAAIGSKITSQGTGYTSVPTVGFTGGGSEPGKQLPTAVALINSDGKVTGLHFTDVGKAMTAAPTVTFTGGGGTSAAATAEIGSICYFDADWTELMHLSGSYVQDLVYELGDLRLVLWAGQFTVTDGVTQ